MLANNPSVLTGGGVATNVVNGTFQLIGPTGSIALTAQGTNQNITLTPSGTGRVSILGTPSAAGSALNGSLDVTDVTAIATGIGGMISFRGYYTGTTATEYGFIRGYKINATDGNYAAGLYFGTRANGSGMAGWMLLNDAGNLLLGTTTDSANGKIQLAAHTTSAGGIGFGTDVSLYRNAANQISFIGGGAAPIGFALSSGNPYIFGGVGGSFIRFNSSGQLDLVTATATSLTLQTNYTTALTLDSSQNATFAGIVIHKSYTVAALPAAAAGNTYGIVFVSDATQLAGVGIGTAPTGGGAVKRGVYSTGAAWLLL